MKLGAKTRTLLKEYGLDDEDIGAIEADVVDWGLVEVPDGAPDLFLYHKEGGQRHVARLTAKQADGLLDVFEFERRTTTADRPHTFPEASLNDWTGVSPETDWQSLVKGYREAADVLGTNLKRDAAAYLFVCRHTLELQLKTIIMLGQQARDITPDLPSHHDLQRLWTTAAPILSWAMTDGLARFAEARIMIEDYHRFDSTSDRKSVV